MYSVLVLYTKPIRSDSPWRSGKDDPNGKKYKDFLIKEEATELVIDERDTKGEKVKCIYDPVVYIQCHEEAWTKRSAGFSALEHCSRA